MTPHAIRVLDDVVPEPDVYRQAALAQPFKDIAAGDIIFHGMSPVGPSPLSQWLEETFGLHTTFSAFRHSPEGQEEPSFIHTDRDMGEWTAILYLNPDPPEGDGTSFWRHIASGAIQSTATTEDEQFLEWMTWRDREQWEAWHTVPAVFNRVLLFPSPYFHSRAIHDNWGEGENARLVQLCFGTGVVPCV